MTNASQRCFLSRSDSSNMNESKTIHKSVGHHCFRVRCLSRKRKFEGKTYNSVDDIKQAALKLYDEFELHDGNAILTYFDENQNEFLLNTIPPLLEKGQYRDLFIKFIHPFCHLCSSSFGILDDQLLFECPTRKCAQQYCHGCVESIQGPSNQYPFQCNSCRKTVNPKRNTLLEEHLIWPSVSKLYGIRSFLDLKDEPEFVSTSPIITDIEVRRFHLQVRLKAFKDKLPIETSLHPMDQQLIQDVEELVRNLINLVDELCDIDNIMRDRNIDIEDVVKKYQEHTKGFDSLCDILTISIEELQANKLELIPNASDMHKKHIKEQYNMNVLDNLPCQQNVQAIDTILLDINFRKKCLLARKEMNISFIQTLSIHNSIMNKLLYEATDMLAVISNVEEELSSVRGNLRAIERSIDKYFSLLQDDDYPGIPCSRFIIFMEMLRTQTEKSELRFTFPTTIQLMNEWQSDDGINEKFKPKVLDLYQSIETDVKQLFTDQQCIYSVPYKIGIIGRGTVGKTALALKMAEGEQLSETIKIERSTFGCLPFDTSSYKHPQNGKTIPITFVDIEGATDNDPSKCIGNYKELINNADADLYLIVFDGQFGEDHREYQQYIEKEFRRPCLLVRSKVDLLFHQFYHQETRKKFNQQAAAQYDIKSVLRKLKHHCKITFDEKRLEERIYLTAADANNDLKDTMFGQFDLNQLRDKLLELAATDKRIGRISRLAILASRRVINICFRRGYVISTIKYQWLAAGAAMVLPLLDEIPAYLGRKEVRRILGVRDNCRETNSLRRTKNPSREYLTEHELTVSKDLLRSGAFKYLTSEHKNTSPTTSDEEEEQFEDVGRSTTQKNSNSLVKQNTVGHVAAIVGNGVRPVVGVLGIVGRVLDDALRVGLPGATGLLRILSIAGIVVGVGLTPAFGAWAYYSCGERMNKHLHLLCDDLEIILVYLIYSVCKKCSRSTGTLVLTFSDEQA